MKGQGIVDTVQHPNSPGARFEAVEVMPEPVRPGALFIDEIALMVDFNDLRDPSRPDLWQHLNAVNDDLTGKHGLVITTLGLKRQIWRREIVEIA